MSISATTTNTQNHHFFQIGLFATVLFGLLIILSLSNDAPNNLRLNHPEPSRTRERHRNDAMPKLSIYGSSSNASCSRSRSPFFAAISN